MNRSILTVVLLATAGLMGGCATSTGLDGRVFCGLDGKAFVARTYGPIQLSERLADADAVCASKASQRVAGGGV